MTSILGKIWSRRNGAAVAIAEPSPYQRAMQVSGELLERMRNYSNGNDPARAVMADVWAQNHNIPFLTTVHEAVQEAKAPLEQDAHAIPSPPPSRKSSEA